jgi:hypothetical protein
MDTERVFPMPGKDERLSEAPQEDLGEDTEGTFNIVTEAVERPLHDGSPIDDTEGFAVAPPPSSSSEAPAASAISMAEGEELSSVLGSLRKSEQDRPPLDVRGIYREAGAGTELDTPAPIRTEDDAPDEERTETELLDQKTANYRLDGAQQGLIGSFQRMRKHAERLGMRPDEIGIAEFLRSDDLPDDQTLLAMRADLQDALNQYVRQANDIRELGLKSHNLAAEITDLATE